MRTGVGLAAVGLAKLVVAGSGQHLHKPLFAGRDIGILAIGDGVSYPHFNDVGSRADHEDLRLAGLHLLAGCGSIDE
jgi:hypothetical protein